MQYLQSLNKTRQFTRDKLEEDTIQSSLLQKRCNNFPTLGKKQQLTLSRNATKET